MNCKNVLALTALLAFGSTQASPVLLTNGSDASLAGATVLSFDGEALGSFNTRAFGSDVSFGSAGPLFVQNALSGYYGTSGRYITNQSTPNPITIDFTGTVSSFGFTWGAADQPWTLQVFDAADHLLSTLNLAAQSGAYTGFIGFIGVDGGGAAIGSARLTANSGYGYDYVTIDNFKYVAAAGNGHAVPEPQSLALVALALAAAAVAARRRA